MRFLYIKLLAVLYIPPILLMGAMLLVEVNWQKLLFLTYVLIVYGIAWDIWSTKHGRSDKLWIWRFNPNTVTGIRISQHPLEEYLFGVGHILWVIFFWELLNRVVITFSPLFFSVLVLVVIYVVLVGKSFYSSQTY